MNPLPSSPTLPPPSARGHLSELTRLSPGRPALLLGARVALATALPLVLAPVIGPVASTWAATGAYSISLVDKGGSYRTRALALGAATLGAAAAVLAGGLAATHALAAVAIMFAWTALCAFAGALGPAAASVGTTTAVLFAIALAWPPSSRLVLLTRVAAIAGAGAWVMALALLFWPVRVYKPARYAVARCFRLLAEHARAWPGLARDTGGATWIETLARDHAAVRDAIERAREVLVATRRGRRGESGRGERLLALLQIVEVIFAQQIQLAELLEAAGTAGAPRKERDELVRAVAAQADPLQQLAACIESEQRLARAPAAPKTAARTRTPTPLPGAPDAIEPAQLHARQAQLLLQRIAGDIAAAHELALTLYDDTLPASEPTAPVDDEQPSAAERLRENLTPASVLFRHATRVAVTTTAAVASTRALHLQRGYWVTITVLVLLQPYTPATVVKTLQRVTGTVLGAIVAALILGLLHGHAALTVLAIGLAGVSVAVLQLNYALYSFFVTPTFVLLAEASARDPRLPALRIVNTILGGLLAFAGARLLWPHAERRRFPDELAAALAALRDYVDAVVAAIAARAPLPSPSLRAMRRRFGLAMNRADASFQRLLAEAAAQAPALEPAMTALLFTRRASASLGAAGSARTLVAREIDLAALLTPLGQRFDSALDDLVAAVREQRAPAPLPVVEDLIAPLPPLLAARFARFTHQLAVLHHAAARALPAPAAPSLTPPPPR